MKKMMQGITYGLSFLLAPVALQSSQSYAQYTEPLPEGYEEKREAGLAALGTNNFSFRHKKLSKFARLSISIPQNESALAPYAPLPVEAVLKPEQNQESSLVRTRNRNAKQLQDIATDDLITLGELVYLLRGQPREIIEAYTEDWYEMPPRIQELSSEPLKDTLSFSADERYLAVGSHKGTKCWNILPNKWSPISCDKYIVFNPKISGQYASLQHNKDLYLCTAITSKKLTNVRNSVVIAFSPDGTKIALCEEERITEFDTTTLQLLKTVLTPHVCSKEYNADSTKLATLSGYFGNCALLHDVTSEEAPRRLNDTFCLKCSPTNPVLVAYVHYKTIILLDVNTRKVKYLLQEDSHNIGKIAFCPRGDILASKAFGDDCRLWEVATGKPLAHVPNTRYCHDLIFSPHNTWFICGPTYRLPRSNQNNGQNNGQMHIWDRREALIALLFKRATAAYTTRYLAEDAEYITQFKIIAQNYPAIAKSLTQPIDKLTAPLLADDRRIIKKALEADEYPSAGHPID